jgi:hypothetical protein
MNVGETRKIKNFTEHYKDDTDVKRKKREAEHLPPASAEVKKMWIYISTPQFAYMAYCLIS